MEEAGCVHLDDNTGDSSNLIFPSSVKSHQFKGFCNFRFFPKSPSVNGNGGGFQRLSLMEIMANKRHHLSDISNSTNHSQRNPRSLPGQENHNLAPLQKAKDYVAELLKVFLSLPQNLFLFLLRSQSSDFIFS